VKYLSPLPEAERPAPKIEQAEAQNAQKADNSTAKEDKAKAAA
jgi:hypothetical protein